MLNFMSHCDVMNKKFITTSSSFTVAIALGMYLASGQSAAVHVVFICTTLFATFMALRHTAETTAEITLFPDAHHLGDGQPLVILNQVEELLSQAS